MDIVNTAEGLVTDQDSYAVFYPNDGKLVVGYRYPEDAKGMRDNLLHLFPDAYVVRVQIERVEA